MKLYKKNEPSVSIILPTFNRSRLILRAVSSVLFQTFENWELIIVDDGSTDATFQLLNKLILTDERVKYVKHSNRKLPLSLNAGLKIASGEYISFLGSDDEYEPDHLELRMKFLKSNPEIDLLHGGAMIVGDEFVKDKNDTSKKIHLSDCVIGGTFFGKRQMFLELEGFNDLKYSEDSDLFDRAKEKHKIIKVNFATYIYYRDTEDSITNTIE